MRIAADPALLEEIGRLVRLERTRCGITQGELAMRVSIDRKTINRIEGGMHSTSVAVLCAIARALDVHPALLLPELQ